MMASFETRWGESVKKAFLALVVLSLCAPILNADDDLARAVAEDYDQHLEELFRYFHSHPELSFLEVETAKRLAEELRAAGVEVTEGVGRHRCGGNAAKRQRPPGSGPGRH